MQKRSGQELWEWEKGIRLAGHKNTASCTPVQMPVPARVRIPLSLLGANTSTILVKKGDTVAVGQPIATQGQGNRRADVRQRVGHGGGH